MSYPEPSTSGAETPRRGRQRRVLAVLLLLILAGCGKMFRRGWSIEAPPPQYASGPTQTGHTTELRVSPEAANYLCHVAGVWQHEPQGFPVACYNPKTDQVILPDKWPSGSELNQMRAHEWGHARNWRHDETGSGTSDSSLPPMAWVDPGFQPNDPQNPAPIYRGPAGPLTFRAAYPGTASEPPKEPQKVAFGFGTR